MIDLRNNRDLINVFSWLRFPMIVFVVVTHANLSDVNIQGSPICNSFPKWYFDFMYFFSEAVTRLAVPVFFIISGYLFFYKIDFFGKNEYVYKLRRRIQSLLIPYLLWNLIGYIFIILKVQFLPSIFPSLTKESHGLDFLLNSLWSIGDGKCPLLYQFWYIRDLMVVVLLSPLIYVFIKKLKLLALIMLFILWFLPIDLPTGLGATSVLFFSIGAYFNIVGGKINLDNKFVKFTPPPNCILFLF